MTQVIFNLTPVPKPRMTQSDRWNTRPATARYWAFKGELQLLAQQRGFTLGEAFRVIFYLPMPTSWNKTKRMAMEGTRHQGKPDLDNLIKAISDSLLPDDDSGVWLIEARKVLAMEGRIVIENLEDERESR